MNDNMMNVYDKDLGQYVGFPAFVGPPGSPGKNGFGNNNIFINPYLVGGGKDNKFPINQEQKFSWSAAGYTVDGWIIGGGSAELTEAGMILHTESSAIAFSQRIEIIGPGLDYTATILADGVLYSATGKFPDKGGQAVTWTNKHGNISITAANPAEGFPEVFFNFPQKSTTTNCTAACLELGTEQTGFKLVNSAWQVNEIPNYGVELDRCHRFFLTINFATMAILCYGFSNGNNQIEFLLPTPTPMRSVPAVTIPDNLAIRGLGIVTIKTSNNTVSVNGNIGTGIAVTFYGIDVTANNIYVMTYKSDTYYVTCNSRL